jgi:predicted alpha/beta hydrolase family esterase
MSNKTQVFMVHGGMTFKNHKDYLHFLKTREVSIEEKRRWNGEYLQKKLGRNFAIIRPRMPLSDNAKYEDWKIYFERFIPLLNDNVIFIGSSLGGIFLAKYLSEHKFPKKYCPCTWFVRHLIIVSVARTWLAGLN